MRIKKKPEFRQFADMLRKARTHRKITQAALAKQLKVGQQALSSWERGTSRPEAKALVISLAKLFPEHTSQVWLAASRHLEKPKTIASALRPVRPLLAELPLKDLTFEQFQDFSSQLLRFYYPGSDVHGFGVPGDMQRGIDIEVRLSDGRLCTFQCKRHQKFGAAKVRSAVRAHKVSCDLAVIMLSRAATAEARTEINRKRKKAWQLWDSKDICERVRSLPVHDALRLVDAFFPKYRQDFLGVALPCAFEDPARHYAPYLQATSIFSHRWAIVGRDATLEAVRSELEAPTDGVLVVAGPGGIGKSRLLKEVIDRYRFAHHDAPVHILPSQAVPNAHDFEIVGEKAGLVVIEDAHDRDDIRALVHSLIRAPNQSRIILVCRPYALDAVRAAVVTAGATVSAGFPILLAGLTPNEAETVAAEILAARRGPANLAREIGLVARDSPLALVVGANLVASKRIHPRILNSAIGFRDALLAGFRDAITGSIGLPADQGTIRAILELVSMVQPVDANSEAFVALASKLTSHTEVETKRAIDLLLSAGVLVKKSRRIRMTPDVLGDYLLEDVLRRDASIAKRAIDACGADQLARLLVNTAKVDWRLSASASEKEELSNTVWARLTEIATSDHPLPENLIEGIVTAAYYRPEQALSLFDQLDARGSLPQEFSKLLRNVAMNTDYTERACRRLLAIGSADKRPENAHPDHPLRIMKELAHIEPSKPVKFCEQIVDFAMEQILGRKAPALDDDLFAVLRAALQPDGHTTENEGLTISIRNFAVRFTAVRGLRSKIITFLLAELSSPNLGVAALSAATLGDALRSPRDVPNDARAPWQAEFADTLQRWRVLVRSESLSATTTVSIERAVHWHASHGDDAVARAARDLVHAIPQSLDHRVTLAMTDPWGHTQFRDQGSGNWIERWREEQSRIADELIDTVREPTAIVEYLRARTVQIDLAGVARDGGAGQFVFTVASKEPLIAMALCESCLADSVLARFYSSALSALMSADPASGVTSINRALCIKGGAFSRDIAWVLAGRQSGDGAASGEETELLLSLLGYEDARVVSAVLHGLARTAARNPTLTAEKFLAVNLVKVPDVVHEYFQEIMNQEALQSALLGNASVQALLAKLRLLPSIEDYWLQEYLKKVSEIAPEALVEFLLDRIHQSTLKASGEKFQALPYLWDDRNPFDIQDVFTRRRLLLRICAWMLSAPDHWGVRFWAPKLFATIARQFDSGVVANLLDWVKEAGSERFDVVVSILRDAPATFALDHVGAVSSIFDVAETFGSHAVRECRSSLFAATISGSRHGSPGQPFPEDVNRKTKAEEALSRLSRGSAVAEFYVTLRKDAEFDIRQKAEEDQALLEEYE